MIESNIHYPTDSSLLWDSSRVLSRLLRRVRAQAPERCPHRFHDKKEKKKGTGKKVPRFFKHGLDIRCLACDEGPWVALGMLPGDTGILVTTMSWVPVDGAQGIYLTNRAAE